MANTASHLVDRVIPSVPVRQYVLSLPFGLRALAAFKAPVLGALARIFVESIIARYGAWAKRVAIRGPQCGAVTQIQRFGSSVNLNVHFHVAFLDGVFIRNAVGRAVFRPAPAPTREELGTILRHVERRVQAWLKRRGLLDERPLEDRSNEAPVPAALEAFAAIAMQRGVVRELRSDADAAGEENVASVDASPAKTGAVEYAGYNLEAGVRIEAHDDLGRERLLRYGSRPPIALGRLRRLPDGRVAFRIKKWRDGRVKSRIMSPIEFLARLSAIIPPPRIPLIRFHGVLGPKSGWRKDVVPKPPSAGERAKSSDRTCLSNGRESALSDVREDGVPAPSLSPGSASRAPAEPDAPTSSRDERHADRLDERAPATDLGSAAAATPCDPTAAPLASAPGAAPSLAADVELLAPNVLGVRHWQRLLGGLLYATTPRLDWAKLLHRTFEVDVLSCKKCGGQLRVLGLVTAPALVMRILKPLGMPTEAPRAARARDPTELFADAGVE
jgi:hypothetical protein